MTGRQMEALRDALCKSFDLDSFDQLLRLRLDIDRELIVGREGLRTVVFKVLNTAIREGWQGELIRAACAYNPGSPALRRFCDEHPDLAAPSGPVEGNQLLDTRPARRALRRPHGDRNWDELRALAVTASRIRPLVVEQHSLNQNQSSYSVVEPAPGPGNRGPSIRLGSRIFWAVEAAQETHLLLLDDGPEGLTFCLCPSWFSPDTRLHPGVTLLPPPSAGCQPFALTGVPGREELVAIFSVQPLFQEWMPTSRDVPARVLSEQDIGRLLTELSKRPADSWIASRTEIEVIV
jgi:hypothetical protein